MCKVVHIITRFIKGGADFNTLYTVEELSKKYKTYLITGKEYDALLVNRVRKKNVNWLKCWLKHYNIITYFISILKIYLLLKKINPKIVHTHSTEAGIIGRWAAWFAKTPIIIHTNHGVPFNRGWFLRKVLILLERITAKITTKIISNANIISKQFLNEKIGVKKQYITIYSGVNLEKIKKTKPNLLIKKRRKIKVLCATRLVKGKGLEDFIKVARLIKSISKDFEFYIAGDGPLKKKLINKAKNDVIFLGYQKDLPSIMKACTLFVLPSYREGTPRVITEALLCGLPVIATRIDGIQEQIIDEKNGFLFKPGDIEELKELIISKKWKKLKPRVFQNFDKKKMVSEIVKLYQFCLKNKSC